MLDAMLWLWRAELLCYRNMRSITVLASRGLYIYWVGPGLVGFESWRPRLSAISRRVLV